MKRSGIVLAATVYSLSACGDNGSESPPGQPGGSNASAGSGQAGSGGAATGGGSTAAGSGGALNGGASSVAGAGGTPSLAGASSLAGGTTGGAIGSGGGGAGGASAGGGAGGSAPAQGCASGSYLLCEDFESTSVGQVPAGWTKNGNASVAEGNAVSGTKSLAISAQDNGARRIVHPGASLGSGHWGRIRYKVQVPVPVAFVHSTIVALQGDGPTRGPEEVRVVDTVKSEGANAKHQFLYNVQPSGAEFGTGGPYDWTFDGQWHCAEWHIDAPTQSYEFFFDGDRVDSISFSKGAGNYAGAEIPTVINEVRVGWNNYQSAPPGFTAWIDDIALDEQRIGCD